MRMTTDGTSTEYNMSVWVNERATQIDQLLLDRVSPDLKLAVWAICSDTNLIYAAPVVAKTAKRPNTGILLLHRYLYTSPLLVRI